MHIVTLEKFLFCFKLETGGYFVGWLGSIFSLLGVLAIVTLAIMTGLSFQSLDEATKLMNIQAGVAIDVILKLLDSKTSAFCSVQ